MYLRCLSLIAIKRALEDSRKKVIETYSAARFHSFVLFLVVWDCGLYALCFAEEVCNGLLKKRGDFYNVSFDAGHAASTRERIKETIHRLAQK